MKQTTQTQLDESIRRLGGEAAVEESSRHAATTGEREDEAEGAFPSAPPPPVELDVGWYVWRGSPLIEPAARKGGIVVDASGPDSVVVVRDLQRRNRQEAWFETWPLADIDWDSAVSLPAAKRVQAAKKILMAIGETINSGRWPPEDEALFMAAARLTAPYSGGRAA